MEDATSVAATVRDGRLVWEVPGKPVSVRLSPDVVGRLGMAVREGFKALPRRGLETGGLLLGTKREAGNQIVVDVDDFEPVESEHAAGPSYLLSSADRCLLEARIAARKAAARNTNTSVVGIYRSHTRREFAITMEDATLFSSYFRKASDVFLLIKSNEGGPPTGGFIIREGGKVLSHSPYTQFPLDGTIVMPTARDTPVSALQITPAPPRAVQIDPLPAPQRTISKWTTGSKWSAGNVKWPIWLATAGGMALAVSLPFGIQRRIPSGMPARPALSLALNVTNTGNGLRLSWDHQAFRHAGRATLWIKDGQEEQRFELDSKQLNEGSVAYWPRNSDVNFRLELLSAGVAVTESVRAIGAPSKAPGAVPSPSPSPSPSSSPAAVAVESPAVPAVKAPLAAIEASPPPAPSPKTPRRDQAGTASRQLSRAFALPRPKPDSVPIAPASLPDPPVVALPLEHSKEVLKAIVPANSLGSHDGADSSFRVSVEPVSGSRLEHLARNIPLIGKRYRHSDYVPPAPLPNLARPNAPHRNVPRDVNIDVKVYVNPSGKVDYSEVLSKVTATDRDLAELAASSARRWEFVPARARDVTVPGEVILHYQFGPGVRMAGNEAPGAH
jgi:hypothetical protein